MQSTMHPLVASLQTRFTKNMQRHRGIAWTDVQERIETDAQAQTALLAMETTGGEPDVVGRDPESGHFVFCDCAAESPAGRRSVCYDAAARVSRKDHAPARSALEMAAEMGIELLTQVQYRALQALGEFDAKTSSWIATPAEVRALGGALFGDRRYGQVFVYHNGAASYYAARGFRGSVRV
ncbi:MAG: DUF4256 domain-containing protein [Comamonadaceae bacterium]|nr:MAG: DUF4256 domain-containing protein [Comamonadaceae bacterium]